MKIVRNFIERVRSKRRIRQERKELPEIARKSCDAENLIANNKVSLRDIFLSSNAINHWHEASSNISKFALPESTGGVNPGDRRAIFYLIHYFKPTSVLEIGTHIGASTVHITSALQMVHEAEKTPYSFTTVDITDVNSETSKPWLRYGASHAPAKMLEQIKGGDTVEFVVSPSLEYMEKTDHKFDFIFLDGDHAAATVYQEIPAACFLLKKGGIILLHDFFPDMKPLWSNGAVHPGPYLAVERLKQEGVPLEVLPLGDLPWPTKLHSHTTSLALLLKKG